MLRFITLYHRIFKVTHWHVWQGYNLFCKLLFDWAETADFGNSFLSKHPFFISPQGNQAVAQVANNNLRGHWHFVSNCQQNSWGRSPICHVLLTIEVASWTGKKDLPFQELILCLLSLFWGQNCSATAFSVSLEMRNRNFSLQQHIINVTQSQGIQANSSYWMHN